MLRIAVLASGNGSNLQAILDRCAAGDVDGRVSLVVSDNPDAYALVRAEKAGVPSIVELPKPEGQKRAEYDARLLDVLQRDRPDLVVLAGFMRIIGPTITQAFKGRIVNIHPSLLPDFRGLQAVRQAVAAGATRLGCSTHLVTDDLDGGPVILQASVAVRPHDSVEDAQRRVLALEHVILPRTVQLFAQGRIKVEGAKVEIAAGDTWITRQDLPLVSGAWYAPGF